LHHRRITTTEPEVEGNRKKIGYGSFERLLCQLYLKRLRDPQSGRTSAESRQFPLEYNLNIHPRIVGEVCFVNIQFKYKPGFLHFNYES
jgi:hypothetical protein